MSGQLVVLSEDETKNLFDKYRNGDVKAREKLILHNLRFVTYTVKKFENTGIDIEELISIGNIGLIKAIDYFDISKNIKFTTFAAKCITNEILMFLRKKNRTTKEISIESIIATDQDGNQLTIEHILEDTKPKVEEQALFDVDIFIIDQIIESLPEPKKEIIKLHFGFYDNYIYTQKEISKRFNISQSYTSRIINSSLKKIKEKYLRMV